MDWIKPQFKKGEVDRAAKLILTKGGSENEMSRAYEVVNNWRASHYYPLNTFKVTLRRYASELDEGFLVAQRIKRLSSIEHKLERFKTLRLSQMQDIGGCRAILSNINQVYALTNRYAQSELRHIKDDVDDYIAHPKPSGYRGIHIIYKYNSEKIDTYNGLYIEIQVRSKLQHAWATAVETVGTFLNQPLKSSLGQDEWLRFFAVMGSVIAIREKSKVLVPNTPSSKEELVQEARDLGAKLNVVQALGMFHAALNIGLQEVGRDKNNYYFLLKLEPAKGTITVTSFSRRQLDRASDMYLKVEKELADSPGTDAVLVSADSIAALKRAYPNYFLDTQAFLAEFNTITSTKKTS